MQSDVLSSFYVWDRRAEELYSVPLNAGREEYQES